MFLILKTYCGGDGLRHEPGISLGFGLVLCFDGFFFVRDCRRERASEPRGAGSREGWEGAARGMRT
jgi:hypothetical protein